MDWFRAALLSVLICWQAPIAAAELRKRVREIHTAQEKQIVADFIQLLSLKNVAIDQHDIEQNAKFNKNALAKRGFATRLLYAAPGTPPAVYGELLSPSASRTIVFYAHYDGQPTVRARCPSFQTHIGLPTIGRSSRNNNSFCLQVCE